MTEPQPPGQPSDVPAPEEVDEAAGTASGSHLRTGLLAYMARNSVAANLIMLVLIGGGIVMGPRIKQEVFPEVSIDMVRITVPYPGASPEEVEEGVLLSVEEAVRGIDGVKHVTGVANEGVATVTVELYTDADPVTALNDVQSAFDRITAFPANVERQRASISLMTNRQQVISLVLAGDVDERLLRDLGEELRQELIGLEGITLAELTGVRPPEISVEVPQSRLRSFGMTLDQVAASVTQASLDVPAGGVKTSAGEVLVRVTEQRDTGAELADVVVLGRPDGSVLRLDDLGNVHDAFQETDGEASFNGLRAVKIDVYQVGQQTPNAISEAVNAYADEKRPDLPAGVTLTALADRSELYRDRMELLLRNGAIGLVLVLLVLGMFLEARLAFWVTMGIPSSILGSLLLMPLFDVSINMISMFAFIVTLGIVVDDAIVVGEAVYKHRQDGKSPMRAAIEGVREVAAPVVFSVLTTIVAFTPLLLVEGLMGKFFRVIPLVVITVLALSLVESLFVLPAHLGHLARHPGGLLGLLHRYQQAVARGVERFVEKVYAPSLRLAIWGRYFALAAAIALFVASIGYLRSGQLTFTFMPKVEGDVVTASVRLPYGAPAEDTRAVQRQLVAGAQAVIEELGGSAELSRGVYAEVGRAGGGGFNLVSAGGSGSHLAQVTVYLVPPDDRGVTTAEFVKAWRARVGELAGVETLTFNFTTGPSGGAPIDVQLSHQDLDTLEAAAKELGLALEGYEGVTDVDNGVSRGKDQLDLKLKPEASAYGVTAASLAQQVRGAFFGAEASRQQRDRDEVRVYVRRPRDERRSEANIEDLVIRTPAGGEIPLAQAAEVVRGQSYTSIRRKDGRRVLNVTADIVEGVTTPNEVLADLSSATIPGLADRYRGLRHDFSGEQEAQREALGSLGTYYSLALFVMFALMAMAFRSYTQPLIIMLAIPFGVIGAIAGHVVMGYGLSLISMMGIVALSGIVVNDSLVLIAAVNGYRAAGMTPLEAILAASQRRFRPIMLTSLTTFFGLAPMILETSVQARFLIPMAISLGFGVLFTTFVILVLVPVVYLVLEDVRTVVRSSVAYVWSQPEAVLDDAE